MKDSSFHFLERFKKIHSYTDCIDLVHDWLTKTFVVVVVVIWLDSHRQGSCCGFVSRRFLLYAAQWWKHTEPAMPAVRSPAEIIWVLYVFADNCGRSLLTHADAMIYNRALNSFTYW